MATKTKARDSVKAPAPALGRGATRYTDDMRRALVQEVIAADKAGQDRKPILEKYAEEWSKSLQQEVTTANVQSCFQNYKVKFGGAAYVPKRTVLSQPKAEPQPKSTPKKSVKAKRRRKVTAAKAAAVPAATPIASKVMALEAEVAAAKAEARAATKRLQDAERRLDRITAALA